MESLVSVLSGGIAFETLPEFADSPAAKEGTVFQLYRNRAESLERPITEVFTYTLKFTDTVRGLGIGAPVEYRGIRVGTVKNIMLGEDPVTEGVVSPVVIIDIEPQRTMGYQDVDGNAVARQAVDDYETNPRKRIAALVEKGLRARLQTGNLVTGQLFVDLDIFPDAEPATVMEGGLYPEIPTQPSSLQGMIANVSRILDKIEQSDLEGTLTNLNALMVSTNRLVAALEREAPGVVKEMDATLESANDTLATLRASASADGEIGNQLQDALREIAAAARSIRVMAEYLQRHPEAMLKGKSRNP